MRILFALPGLHRYSRGAEVAFISVARELTKIGEAVTLIGSGQPNKAGGYQFLHSPSLTRERFEGWPSIPILRNEYAYEYLTFVPGLLWNYRPANFDVTLTCNYPFTNWVLRRTAMPRRPAHVFVTENGDWPAVSKFSEYRFFGCEGLICTNPDYYDRNRHRWNCKLIPNGIDLDRFYPGAARRQEFNLPADRLVVLMVSALIPSKRVGVAIEAVSQITNAHLIVAGDGPLRDQIDGMARALLPNRFTRLTVNPDRMPDLYRSANVFLHLSTEESFGNVFLEALACGLPIVAHDFARLRWIVGDREFLLDTTHPHAIAEQIEIAARSQNDKDQRAGIAANFSWSKVASMYRDFLQEIVNNNKRKAT